MPMKTALYSGSFDPPTFGHQDVIARAARSFDRLVVALGVHHAKKPLFSADDRLAMLAELTTPIAAETGCRIETTVYDGLIVDAARKVGAQVIVRGLRNVTDFDYEAQMSGMNGALAPEVDTVLFLTRPGLGHITSTFVRQIAAMGGDVSAFVPPAVADRLRLLYAST
ncbi:pantetheine-phosphate adenylyltransferase [Oryzibacter oryziterrae]|uniref:pantetheine-phosphate adenylyltransferase n=1 Tax=Oryzibacter oryziterrae TaxID=2766474 RepID=UPI001F003EA8|nr:pantetheine-phosphate adenylyltransferase [Oryzibacter oryziterrae]